MEHNLCTEIRKAIMKQKEPFCISDLYDRLKELTNNKTLILQCLDELYAYRLLDYKHIKDSHWAFVVL